VSRQRRQLSAGDRRTIRGRLADFFVTVAAVLRGDTAAQARQFTNEVRLGESLATMPGQFPAGAVAWTGCLEGNYHHLYQISSGFRAGDVYLCCVPIDELLRQSFDCGSIFPRPWFFGSPADQKVQTCTLLDPVSEELRLIPACIPAPTEAPEVPRDMSPSR
jgi:hypothetical protein